MRSADGNFEYRDRNDDPCAPGTPSDQVHRFAFRCRACKKADHNTQQMCSVNLGGRGHDIPDKNWNWDGNVDQPTLHPSVNCNGCWHGWINQGRFMKADNQTLEQMQ